MYIKREKYINQVMEARNMHRIVLLTGLRGSGKTMLLDDIFRLLKAEKPPLRIIRIDCEKGTNNARSIIDEAHALGAGPSALLIDNGDAADGVFEAAVEILARYSVFICITGRRTDVLEQNILQLPLLNAAVIRIHPFTYSEFLQFYGLSETQDTVLKYLVKGGLPVAGIVPPDSSHSHYLMRLLADSFVLENIIERFFIRNPQHIRFLLEMTAQTAGEQISARAVCSALSARRSAVSPQTALEYLDLCRISGLTVPIPLYELDKKKTVETGSVWYFSDVGMRSAFAFSEKNDIDVTSFSRYSSGAGENALLLRLLYEGWSVCRGRVTLSGGYKETVTFAAEKEGKKMYVQYIPAAAGAAVYIKKREALLAVRDGWPKIIISAQSGHEDSDGILVHSLREALFSGIMPRANS